MTTWASTSQDELDIHWQDVLGLDGSSRTNLPEMGKGYWEWRFSWDQVKTEHAQRLVRLCGLYWR